MNNSHLYCDYQVRAPGGGSILAYCRRKAVLDNLCDIHHPVLHALWFEHWQREHGFTTDGA
jgi:hypothetical protein